jgi:hypothetical protein
MARLHGLFAEGPLPRVVCTGQAVARPAVELDRDARVSRRRNSVHARAERALDKLNRISS